MCYYIRLIFQCSHRGWGRKVKGCPYSNNFACLPTQPRAVEESDSTQPSALPDCCPIQLQHGMQTLRLDRKCDSCQRLDEKFDVVKRRLAESRKKLESRLSTIAAESAGRRANRPSLRHTSPVSTVPESPDEDGEESDEAESNSDTEPDSEFDPGLDSGIDCRMTQ